MVDPKANPRQGSTSADVIIIGGGLHGCSTALQLGRRGVRALVIEADHVGRHASGVNAGGVRRLGRHLAEVPMSVASMQLWHRIGDLVDDDCGFESHGQVRVAENEAQFEQQRQRVEALHALGHTHEELIGASELRGLIPAIAPHCVGAIVSRADGAALPYRTTLAFARKAVSLGARLLEGTRVTTLRRIGQVWRVQTDRGDFEAPVVVNAAGAWADRIAAQLDEPVPLEPLALMLMITERVAPFLQPVVGAQARTLSFKQFANGTTLIAGGMRGRANIDAGTAEIDYEPLSVNVQSLCALFPAMQPVQIVRAWAGLEAHMPDRIPVIGPSSTHEGVWHQFGFSAHGFQLGPIVGSIVADLITTGATSLPIEPFSIARFSRAAWASRAGESRPH